MMPVEVGDEAVYGFVAKHSVNGIVSVYAGALKVHKSSPLRLLSGKDN